MVSRRVRVIDGLLMLLIYYHGRQESQGYRWVVNVIDLLSGLQESRGYRWVVNVIDLLPWSPGESGL